MRGPKIEDVWQEWPRPRPKKRDLAEAFRPILVAKVRRHMRKDDESAVVPVLRIVPSAVREACSWRANSIPVLRR